MTFGANYDPYHSVLWACTLAGFLSPSMIVNVSWQLDFVSD
jgi:hypothetical protein